MSTVDSDAFYTDKSGTLRLMMRPTYGTPYIWNMCVLHLEHACNMALRTCICH